MKRSNHPALYFSAYPLKAIKKSSSEQSPFLRAILSGKTRTFSRVRVSPMLDLYKGTSKPVTNKKVNEKKDIEPAGNGWFNNYE